MERQCPHCGKVTQVSDEELALHGNVVVCPQCLTVYGVDGVTLTADEARRHRQTGDDTEGMRYCPACGKRLNAPMNFCPNCGLKLQGGDTQPRPLAPTTPLPETKAEPESQGDKTSRNDEDGTLHIPFLPYRFKTGGFEALFPQPKASRRTQAVAYTIILLLLALLVAIIVAAYKIQ